MRTIVVVAALAAALSSFSACTAEADNKQNAAATPAIPATPAVAATVPAGPLGTLLTEADVLRQTLADDRTDTLAASAAKLDAEANALAAAPTKAAGSEGLTAATKGLLEASSQPTIDLKAVRLAYGEFQKQLVGIIAADASLQPGRYLFECPMARGYQRWVQVSPKMSNPYMGKRMLECGTTIEGWKVAG